MLQRSCVFCQVFIIKPALSVLMLFGLCLFSASLRGQHVVDPSLRDQVQSLSPITIDGHELFFVRGVLSYPAELRAKSIQKRIYTAARNHSIAPEQVRVVPDQEKVQIFAGPDFIMSVYDADGEVEGVSKELFAELIVTQLKATIKEFRHLRSGPMIKRSVIKALLSLVILVIVLFVFSFLFKRLNEIFKRRVETRVQKIENASFNLIQSRKLFEALQLLYHFLRITIIIFICVGFLNYFLGQFPWTKGISVTILKAVLDPLKSFGRGFIEEVPNLIVLALVWLITKYILRFIRLLFVEIRREAIHIKGFDSDWAMPSFRIIRLLTIVFALVVAFPYIPGSDTNAFKGISVFLGIIFSLGSSSFIANIVAGYSITYQGAFKLGDLIRVNEHIGFVEAQSTMVTRLRSPKNEEIVIPNSFLINSNVVNYSRKAKQNNLILHTTVGIGYETPWRLVDAMLKLAAKRTNGILSSPEPFVLKKALGDFAVTYELNAYCGDESQMNQLYSELHQNILDVFNENDVAIMTPAYEADTESPKVVPKDKWNTPLANEE